MKKVGEWSREEKAEEIGRGEKEQRRKAEEIGMGRWFQVGLKASCPKKEDL